VQVVGAVGRPAHYELSGTDDLPYVLGAAGGFAGDANRERMTIHRVARPEARGPGLVDRQATDLALRVAQGDEANAVDGVLVPPVGLQDGDSVVVDAVPPLHRGYYVTIAGMVMSPDTLPWHDGMTLRDAVLLARGPSVGADLREAEVSRLPADREAGELATLLRVPLDSSYLSQRDPQGRFAGPRGIAFPSAGASPEFTLEPFDQIQVLRQPDFEMPTTVQITGEVPVPGQYTLRTRNDQVTELIERAGGLLRTGYPEGARLFRQQDAMGRIDIDLPAALASPDGRNNVVLQPGDSLHIPVYSPTVVVSGAVNSPITVLYREGEGLDYYVENAGGYRNDADKGRLSVRYANGQARTREKFLLWSSYPPPGPGSTVTVPAQDPADRFDTSRFITDLVSVTGSISTVFFVIWQISRD
jgi:protein involved in polysaccharide export with SLBB domain